MLQISGKASIDLKRLNKTLESRLEGAATAVTKSLADYMARSVRDKIPEEGGWLDLYRDSLKFVKVDALTWAVLGEADIELTTVPAERTLLEFVESDYPIMVQLSPWAIDAIPAVVNGYRGKFVVKAASEDEVKERRAAALQDIDGIKDRLEGQGARVEDFGIPKINGVVVADLAFLSKRLEYGLGGYPRVPHWNPVVLQVKTAKGSQALTTDTLKAVDRVMRENL